MKYQTPKYFTDEQKHAIEFDGNNVLVSAAAGCGKTTLMIQRIIRKVLNNRVNIDEIIVVTFTEAAAAELKERLEKELNKNIDIDPEFINHQLSILNDAYISTFHALCLRLLEENGVLFNFDNTIKVADATQLKNLKIKAFNILEKENIYNDEYLKIREQYTTITDYGEFFNLINNTLEVCITKDSLKNFIAKANSFSKPTSIFEYDDFSDIHIEASLTTLSLIIKLLEDSFDETNSNDTELKISNAIEFFKDLEKLIIGNDYQKIHTMLNEYKFFSKPRETINNAHESIRLNHAKIKIEIEDNLKPLYRLSNDEYLYLISNNNFNIKSLLTYVEKYHFILNTLKKETGILEFNDLEQEVLKLLYCNDQESEVALSLKPKFNEIMIDEYQDTNLIQEKIVSALANGSNTFMVGDVKQSIYRFRNATPQLFSDKYTLYKNSDNGIVIDLSDNFRSKNEVLETTNFIFKSTFSKNIGGIDYDKNNQLNFANKELNNEVGDFKTKLFYNITTKDNKLNKAEKYLECAKAIVNEIKKLVNNNREYRDIAILFKQRTHSKLLTNLLTQENIPFMIHDNSGFYTSYEIRDLLNLLKVLTNKNDDIAMLSVLRSYFFNLDENDLLELSLVDGKFYYDKLKNSNFKDEFILFNDLLNYAKDNSPLNIINYIYEKTTYINYIISHNNYEQFLMNISSIKKILNENLDYYNSLEYLIKELDQNISSNFDTAKPATLSEKENVVNIMTIHKSKGLEFKYVFLFDEGNIQFDNRHLNSSVKAYKNNLILKYFDSSQKTTLDTNKSFKEPLSNLISFANKKEILAEELRVLYVALTRAKLQLYIFTNIDESRLLDFNTFLKNENDWLISEPIILDIKRMLEPTIISFIRHKDALKFRESAIINAPDNIYKYYNNLFELCEFDNSLLSNQDYMQNNINTYKIQHISKTDNSLVKPLEKVVPSSHKLPALDFDNIKEFDTFNQGKMVHRVFELLDFTSSTIENDLEQLIKKYNVYQKNYQGILAFIKSDYFKIFKDNIVKKEYSFSLLKDGQLINGIIDLYIETANDVYIVDYKSDNLSPSELIKSYQEQLHTYKKIIEKQTSKQIKCLIYSTINQQFIEI
ncbi:ATP-dependent helicase/nuclease subunit A [Bacilli bacterium PM5-9]|nr:ATP-dependent helicase/nuclease subunit A [Bacilli bacterium PM5-9]